MSGPVGRAVVVAAALLGLAVALEVRAAPPAPTVEDVSKALICQCGCANMVLFTCQCSMADQWRRDIRGMIGRGMSREAILASYVDRYGEKVLAVPVASGFNITAWVMPIGALLAGASVILVAVRRWVRRSQEEPVLDGSIPTVSPDVRERLEREVREREG